MSETESGGARTTRGRPYRPIGVINGVRGAGFRIAWLLRANRVLGHDRAFSTMSTFAAAFHGGSFAGGISDSTVSRWETGGVRAPFSAIRRYEDLLGLPPGQLVSVADTIYRYAAPTLDAAPVLARTDGSPSAHDEEDLNQLLERALSDDAISGWNWDELTSQLFAMPRFFLPGRMWTDLSMRLLEETVVATGVAWMQRFESLTRLLGHPASQRYAVDACVRLVHEPGNQVFVEPTSVLDATSHPDAATFLLEQLTDPVNERARYGSLLGCVRKVRYGHFKDEQLDRLARAVLEIMRDPDSDVAAGPLAAELLRRLPDERQSGLGAELRRTLAGDHTLQAVHGGGRLVAKPTADLVVDRIVTTVAAGLGSDAVFTDHVLPVLVDEMLFSPVLDTRLNAAILIWATPYAAPIASAVATELRRSGAVPETRLASLLLASLRVLGGPEHRPLVERLVLANGLPPRVRLAAVHCVGHVGGTSSDAFWLNALARYGRQWTLNGDATSAEALSALVYALGIARNHHLLTKVRDDETAPPPVRSSAAWWLARPARLFAEPAAAVR